MSDATLNIKAEEWLSELEKLDRIADEELDGCFTASELAKIAGRKKQWARNKVGLAIAAGLVVLAGKRKIKDISGRLNYIPIYKLVRKPRKK